TRRSRVGHLADLHDPGLAGHDRPHHSPCVHCPSRNCPSRIGAPDASGAAAAARPRAPPPCTGARQQCTTARIAITARLPFHHAGTRLTPRRRRHCDGSCSEGDSRSRGGGSTMAVLVDTRTVPPRERFACWHEAASKIFFPLRI